MASAQTTLQNFASGELSSKVRGRYELPAYQHGLERGDNFIMELQGPARFRNGFRHVRTTRRNKIGCFLKFQFSNSQSYALEFTDGYLRFYKDNGVVVETAKNITAITKANPGVVTSVAHGFLNGDEVFISGVKGMTGVNGKFFLVANKTADTFQLTDQDGNNVSTLSYSAYSSAGTAERVYEIVSPYLEADDLFLLRITQNADTAYIVHPKYEPRKLTRAGATSFAINLYTRTADPFLSAKVITGITQANPANVTAVAHGYLTGQQIVIAGIVGMTQLNGRHFTITKTGADNFTLDGVDSTAYTAYVSDGYASDINLLPAAATFHQGRLCFTAIASKPLGYVLSRAPTNAGVTRYDDYTTGTDADHAVIGSITAEDESATQWIKSNVQFLLIGGFTGIFKITGGTDSAAITPTSAQALRISAIGVSNINPVTYDISTIYSEQQNLIVRSLDYNILWQNFLSKDKNLISDHITAGGIKQFAFASGRPDIVWAVTNDGKLIGMTFKIDEEVFGWHRHSTRTTDKYISAVALPRTNAYHRLWAIIERPINGHTRRYVSYLEDPVSIPEEVDFYTGEANYASDHSTFLTAMYEAQKQCFHLDSGLTYDGSDLSIASVTIGAAATSGNGIHFTASGAIFVPGDVGREIRLKPVNGVGAGRATIITYVSTTEVVCDITETFVGTMTAGHWYFTIGTVTNLDHLEGLTVRVITDGAAHEDQIVSGGQITLDFQASVVHVGIKARGILKSMNLEVGGVDGPSQTKPKNVIAVGIKFYQTLGAQFGADVYKLQPIEYRAGNDIGDRPPPLFSGSERYQYEDEWEREKHIVIVQDEALPCNVQLLMPYTHTDNG